MNIEVNLADLYQFTEDAVNKILKPDNEEDFSQAVGELQLLLRIVLDVEPNDDTILALRHVLMILDRVGMFIDSPDCKVTAAIVLPYLQKTRIENAGDHHADAN